MWLVQHTSMAHLFEKYISVRLLMLAHNLFISLWDYSCWLLNNAEAVPRHRRRATYAAGKDLHQRDSEGMGTLLLPHDRHNDNCNDATWQSVITHVCNAVLCSVHCCWHNMPCCHWLRKDVLSLSYISCWTTANLCQLFLGFTEDSYSHCLVSTMQLLVVHVGVADRLLNLLPTYTVLIVESYGCIFWQIWTSIVH